MNIVFLGAQGTGKGTLAALLVKDFGFNQISPGNLFREEIKKNSELGKKVKGFLDKGILVPHDITNQLVKQSIKKNNIFDGYPRTVVQAEALEGMARVDRAVVFDMPEDEVVKRLGGRLVCTQCQAIYHIKNIPPKKKGLCDVCSGKLVQRDDDKPDIIRKRFQVYKDETLPVLDYYKKNKILHVVDARGTPGVVYIRIKKLLSLGK